MLQSVTLGHVHVKFQQQSYSAVQLLDRVCMLPLLHPRRGSQQSSKWKDCVGDSVRLDDPES